MKLDPKKCKKVMALNAMNQASVARATKLTPRAVSRAMRGETEPQAATMQKICKVLNCKPADLLQDFDK